MIKEPNDHLTPNEKILQYANSLVKLSVNSASKNINFQHIPLTNDEIYNIDNYILLTKDLIKDSENTEYIFNHHGDIPYIADNICRNYIEETEEEFKANIKKYLEKDLSQLKYKLQSAKVLEQALNEWSGKSHIFNKKALHEIEEKIIYVYSKQYLIDEIEKKLELLNNNSYRDYLIQINKYKLSLYEKYKDEINNFMKDVDVLKTEFIENMNQLLEEGICNE